MIDIYSLQIFTIFVALLVFILLYPYIPSVSSTSHLGTGMKEFPTDMTRVMVIGTMAVALTFFGVQIISSIFKG
jgi:hypothetical protein